MVKDIVIIGASGHGKEVALLIEQINLNQPSWNIVGFIDDRESAMAESCLGYPVLSSVLDFVKNPTTNNVVVAIGDPRIRRRVVKTLKVTGCTYPSLVHPSVFVHRTNSIGVGVVIFQGAQVMIDVKLGNHVHLNTQSSVSHESVLSDYATISPGVHVSGNVKLHSGVFLGTGTQVAPGLEIGEGAVVGAGATVVANIEENVVAVGSPARAIKQAEKF